MAHRVISADSVAVKPAAPSGTQQYFSDGPPGTVVPATWLNMLQDELVTALALKGITPDPADDTQLAQLLAPSVQVLTGYLAAGSPVSTTTTMGRAVLASDDCTAGSVSASDTRILVAASEDTRVGSANSCAVASSNCVIDDGRDHFIAACRADGVDNIIIDGSTIRNSVALAYRQQTASGAAITEDLCAIIAAHDAVVSGPKSAVLAVYDVTNDGTESLIAASEGVEIGPGTAENCVILGADISGGGTEIKVGPSATSAWCCAAIAIAELGGSTLVSGTGNLAAACAGVTIDGAAGAIRSAVLAVSGATMDGQESAIIGGQAHNVEGDFSVVLGGTGASVTSARSSCIGGENNAIDTADNHFIGCEESSAFAGRANVVLLASRYVATSASAAGTDFQVMGGVNVFAGAPLWRLDSTVGRLHSTVAPTTGGLDYAEWFPNADGVAHPPGRLLARTGRQVTLGQPGRRPIGVVSCSPSIVGGDDSLGWARRHATDEWGRPLYDEVELEAGRTVRVLRPNPEYDPSRAAQHVPRSQRPDEWTLVGLVGQLLVAVEADVAVDDFLECGEAGLGRRAAGEARLEVMEIVRPFDPVAGYAQALVLVR